MTKERPGKIIKSIPDVKYANAGEESLMLLQRDDPEELWKSSDALHFAIYLLTKCKSSVVFSVSCASSSFLNCSGT